MGSDRGKNWIGDLRWIPWGVLTTDGMNSCGGNAELSTALDE